MLYERWRDVVRRAPDSWAILDLGAGRRWTFAELDHAARAIHCDTDGIVFPQDRAVRFLLTVLAAWRAGRVVCPLEPDQSPPSWPMPPSPFVHLKLTSASSGPPKGVVFTAEQLAADADQIVVTMGLRPAWPNLAVISLAHSYGFSNLVLPLLLHGIPLILAETPLPETVRLAQTWEPPLTLPAVPALWQLWRDADVLQRTRIALAISAGAPLPLALEHDLFEAAGIKVHNFYGASECGGIAYDRSNAPRTDPDLAGSAMHRVRLTLSDDGCVAVHSPAVGTAYWPEPGPALGAGCFRTSDLGALRDGRVHLLGRASDTINVGGRKVQPETVETALRHHPAVKDCVVFGLSPDSSHRNERIAAVVATAAEVSEADLRRFLSQVLSAWQVPRDWWFRETLETNARGKISRAEWRRRFCERDAQSGRG